MSCRCRTLAAVAAAPALLAACGVGLTLGEGFDDDPPSVSLAAAPQEAVAGQRIGLVAAASDDYAVRAVSFYRVDALGNTLLGRDTAEPFAIETELPGTPGTSVRYFARAEDDAGQETDSAAVTVLAR